VFFFNENDKDLLYNTTTNQLFGDFRKKNLPSTRKTKRDICFFARMQKKDAN